MIATVASQQILSLRRQRIFLATLGLFVAMTAAAGVLGWSSHNTIVRVYDQAVKLLASEGKPAPPNPFLLKPELSLLSNMVVYIPLLGALLALLMGHLSVADDDSTGLGRLIFSRRVSRSGYALGKVTAAAAALAVILLAAFAVSLVSLAIVNQTVPTVGVIGRLVLFYGLSWLYLMVFALVGMGTALLNHRRSLGLLTAMGLWLVITFAVPQFTSGLRPTTSLNPITDPVGTSQRFFQITAMARPVSIAEQYKAVSGQILATAPAEPLSHALLRVLPIGAAVVVILAAVIVLVRRHDFSRSSNGE
jgi:ABC-type transport system involved in multi-copper enzyme maturation permease subunit